LFKNNLPYSEILKSIDSAKISRDIDYLIENRIIEESKGTYILTDKGKIISDFNLGMNAAIFLVNCILFASSNRVDNSYYYYVTLITTWIDSGKPIFYEPSDKTSTKYQELLRDDSLETFLNVWDKYNESKDKNKWSFDYNIQIKSIKEINDNRKFIIRTLITNYKVKKSDTIYVTKSYLDVKGMIINQLLSSFPNFKLKNKSTKDFQNYKKEPFVLNSKIFIAGRPNEFILGLTFFCNSGITYVTNFINRDKDAVDIAFEQVERIEKEQERLAQEQERKEHEELIRLEEKQAAITLEENRLRLIKEEADKLEAVRLQKQKKEEDFPPLGGKPKQASKVSLKFALLEEDKLQFKAQQKEKEKLSKLKKKQNNGFLFSDSDD
jgi:hypothetical protein